MTSAQGSQSLPVIHAIQLEVLSPERIEGGLAFISDQVVIE